ncbi:hypothetical protein CKF54_04400 [Psittacicella hinzii]|uniref:Restriction endonuclease type II NgoFVII C-terminal B3-like DNA-binding domain-containing protein n=1 Tax=Psittacicella hinzii TaxID=2028575 RepID=A0A3A1Y5Z7_9GAMM|nr:restriction endonuclease PLD domain-containing protein [Psittacicella hinzii]RIY32700.1 hypothetical protein CKF54_04400 [Psittacicella hinzii]
MQSKSYLEKIEIHIKDDPYQFLLNAFGTQESSIQKLDAKNKTALPNSLFGKSSLSSKILSSNSSVDFNETNLAKNNFDYIILPLYSPRSNQVELKSGLNQWNAGGRKRELDEVYIPVPSWIHKKKKGFFTYKSQDFKTDSFDVKLPSGKVISMRIVQQGGKALMSNPNSYLGEWILRKILDIPRGVIVTKSDLNEIGIDSVILYKHDEFNYSLDFLPLGSYEKFAQEYNS